MYLGCIVNADDIVLISASVVQLQQMLDLCSTCADDLDIHFNHRKSNLITFGHDYIRIIHNLKLKFYSRIYRNPAGQFVVINMTLIFQHLCCIVFFQTVNHSLCGICGCFRKFTAVRETITKCCA